MDWAFLSISNVPVKEAKLIKLCGLRETHSHKRKERIPHRSVGFWSIFFWNCLIAFTVRLTRSECMKEML